MTDLDRRAKLLAKLRARKQGSAAAPEAAAESPKTIPRVERDGPLPLSFGQERIWLLDRLMPNSNSFNMPFALRLVGDLDADALRRAIESLIARHESLRTTFVEIDGTPKQVVHEPASVTVERRDLSHLPEAERQRQAEVLRDELAAQPFDLERGPLFRSTLLRLSETEHHLIQVAHHIVSDGWSTGVLLRELRTLLAAFTSGEPSPLKPLPIQYADFAAWQRERLSGDYLGKLVDYWRDNLDGSAQTLALGTDRPRPAVPSHRGAKIDHAIGHRLVDRLEAFGRGERTSLYMVLLAGFDALMARLAGQDDVLVGSPVAGRQRLETEGVVGFFLNTLVLRTAVDRGQGFRSLLKAVRSTVLGATEHQEIPFEKLLEELRPERHLSQTPFFQVMFNMTNLPDLVFDLPGLRVEGLDYESISAKFDFTLYASENPKSDDERLMLTLSYDAELFDHARMREMLDQYELLLEQLVEAPDRPIGDASLITDRARRLLPDPTAPLDASWRGTIADAMLRHAAEHPDEPAVIDVDGTTTYGQLTARSARIARRLLDEGLRHGDVVAVWAHRSAPVVGALMGVLRAGAAFTMLDPQYPIGRLLDYVELAEPRAVIALDAAGAMPAPLVDALAARCADADGDRRIVLPASGVEPLPEITSTDGVDPEIGPEDLAYVAFTSGSTGKPKTILGRQAPLTHFLPFLAKRFGFDAGDRHALLSALSHDPLHRDVFMPLYYGAAVVLPDPERIGEPGYLAQWVEREQVTILNLVPAMLQLLVSTAPESTALGSIRHVFTVGDVLTRQDVDNLYRIAPNAVCVNYYGSTETQRAVSFVELPRPSSPDATLDPTSELGTGGLGKAALPLGRGLDGVQLLVLDADGRQVGIGEPGEIFVRSHMLARGYADPERTAERFLANPFVDDAPATDRLYRTGDLGRYLPNGDVDFLGRSDFQVQIRGFRIELQEIEMALEAHPAIGESVVLVRGEGDDKYLAAYLVAATGAEIPEPRALRHHLAERLPDYMIPTAWSILDAFPLTRTGKLDRRTLPDPEPVEADAASAPPETPAETTLADIWAELLGREAIGRHDHFFELGGHSLLATRMLARVREVFGVDAPLRLVFEAPTLAEMAAALVDAEGDAEDGAERAATIVPVDRGAPLPVSFAQRRLWFLDQLEPDSAAYVLSAGIRMLGRLDREAFSTALDALVARHETLRTRLVDDAGEPIQVVDPPRSQALPLIDLSDRAHDAALTEARRRAAEETRQPMDLAAGPLLRTTLLRLRDDDHVFLLSIHHIVSDGWSTGIFFRDLSTFYDAALRGRDAGLVELPVQYADFAAWEQDHLSGARLDRQLDFWREQLDGAPASLELPTDRPRPAQQTFVGTRHRIHLSAELSKAITACSQTLGATPFMTLLAAWSLLLGRHAGQDDVVVGTPVAHRDRTELEGLIGLFANTLPLRTRLAGVGTFAELVDRVRRGALDALAHQDLPFEKLVIELEVERNLSHSPIFQVMFSMQNLEGVDARFGDLQLTGLSTDYGRSQFDINLVLSEGRETADAEPTFGGWLEYNTDLFDAATIDAYARRLTHLLEQLTADPHRPLDQVDLLGADERATVLQAWNDTARERPASTLHQLIAERAAVDPERAAVTGLGGAHDGVTWTYGDVLARARRIARHLRDAGAGPDQLVGVLLHRSPDALAVLLGILEAGAGYLPLDPDYPSDRLSYMVESSGATLVVTDGELPESTGLDALATSRGVRFVRLDAEAAAIDEQSDAPLDVAVDPENLAYAIYTSGSTGLPKGVQIPHRAIVNFLRSMAVEPGLDADDVLLSVTTLSFDIAGLEHFLPLAVGARVVIADRSITGDGLALRDVLADPAHGLTVMQATPATWRMLVDAGWQGTDGLEVLCGGEALPADLARELTARSAELWNVYGPTETTVWSTTRQVLAGDESPHGGATVTVGFPIDNTTVYLLDAHGQPVPPGAVGELLIGGDGLARGYRGRGGLTAERFVPHPFGDGERLYRTGDLARHRLTPDGRGDLEFLGRLDHQVKVRGFRIELGEIESVLREHPEVGQAVVTARTEGGDARLVAYVVPNDGATAAADTLRRHLAGSLPDYMVPSIVVHLDALPLTPNGKVDRKALPAPDIAAPTAEYEAPDGEIESMLATLWAEILDAERVGRRDHFFALGGHSLLATRMLARLRDTFDVVLPVRAVFESPTLAEMAQAIHEAGQGDGAALPPITPVGRDEPLPVSSAQRRLWFLDRLDPGSTAYVLSAGLRVLGPLDHGPLTRAVDRLVARHESLRTRIVDVDSEPVQVVDPPSTGRLVVVDLGDRSADAALAEARRLAAEENQKPMDLAEGPLLRTTLVRLADDDHALLVSIHHIVSDGWSMGILFRELSALYDAAVAERAADLPALPLQYGDFAAWEQQHLVGDVLDRQLGFWRQHLAGAPTALELPTDRPRPAQQTFVGTRHPVRLSPELSTAIDTCSRELGATPFMTLLAAWSLLLGRHSGQDDVVVGTPVAHREHVEIEHLIGFFANTLALRTRLDAGSFAELVGRVRRTTLDALSHQDLPFEKLIGELDVERNLAHSPIFQVMFSMQNLDGIDGRLGKARLASLDAEYSRSQFDINLLLSEGPIDDHPDAAVAFGGFMEYNTDLFDAATIEALGRRWIHLLEQVTADPHRPLAAVDLLGADERARVLDAWNDTARELPALTLHRAIAERAAADPERAAVTGLGGAHDGVTWTYGDLLARARRIGHHLRDAGARPDQLVGVLLHRSPDALAVLLGILEAGAGYLPLDPDYPSDRLAYMIESSGATLVVTDGELPESTGLAALATSRGVRFVRLDADAETIAARPDTALDVAIDPEHLAYAIYTSGSTGLPKGVQIPHRAIVNFLRSMADAPGLDADDVLLSVTTLSFDIAGLEHFLPLTVGARVVIADRSITGDGLALRDVLADPAHGLTVMQATPATWRMLVDADWRGTDGLKVLSGGEALPADLARELTARSAELWNVYGPTETTVWSTTRQVVAGDESPHGGATVTVGFPIDNTTVYLLDAHGQPVPPGAVGELLIGGDGLARGYRGRGGLTAERFVPHPFGDGERLYRTGDLARHRHTPDGRGDLEFLGRIDHQVKVRGFRIELGEIESVLREHAGVDQAVVMARTDGGSAARLVAYVVAGTDAAAAPTDDALRAHLGASLPEYMVPAIVVHLDSLPLTPNGKVDRKALPAPDVTTTTAYVAPDGDVETTLAAIWAEVLKVEQVGRQDNFFALGGDSILIIQVVTRAKKAGLSLQPRDLFQQPDLAALARVASVVTEPSEPRPYRPAAAPRDDRIDIVGDIGDDDLDDILGELDL